MAGELHEISAAIGGLKAGQEAAATARDHLERSVHDRLDKTDTKIDTLIREVRSSAHEKNNQLQALLGLQDVRITKLERAENDRSAAIRTHRFWTKSVIAAVSGSATLAGAWVAQWLSNNPKPPLPPMGGP